KWSHEAGRAIGAKEDAKSLNAYLDALSAQVYQAKLKLIESGNVVSAENLKNLIVGKGDDRRTILKEFAEHNNQMAALVGKEFVAGTLCRYRTTYNYVKSFIQWKYGKDDLALHELNFDFVSDFAFWLKSVKNCEH